MLPARSDRRPAPPEIAAAAAAPPVEVGKGAEPFWMRPKA
jgi:hypothetical protein